ncbi:hypothetical protein D3C87_1104910 [compost metagenome]
MGKSLTKHMDEVLACDLERELFQYTVTIKHTLKLTRVITGFVFAYTKDNEIYYDMVPLVYERNGMRIKLPKFAMPPVVKQRIAKHQYLRWYVYSNTVLYPLQTAKPSALEESFIFTVDDNPYYQTQTAYQEETMFLRKKPLMHCRPLKPGWGVTLRRLQIQQLEPA